MGLGPGLPCEIFVLCIVHRTNILAAATTGMAITSQLSSSCPDSHYIRFVSGGNSDHHRVDRVLSFLSSRPNWASPPPHTQASVYPSPLVPRGGGQTRLRERGWGSPNSNEGTDTVVLKVYMYLVQTTISQTTYHASRATLLYS
jgi:hypothetical protein